MLFLLTAMLGPTSDHHYSFGSSNRSQGNASYWWMGYDTKPRNQRKSAWF